MTTFNAPWIIKYRPTTLDNFLCDDSFRSTLKNFLTHPQHLLLESFTPGTGKTTIAYVLINELNADYQVINSSKDRRIEVIREVVQSFASSKSSKPGVPKVLFLDEADGLTSEAQDALRNLMETYADNCIFILTCNYLQKINPYIQSRCMKLHMNSAPRGLVINHLSYISKQENLQITSEAIGEIVNINYPDMRTMLVKLQELKLLNREVTIKDITNTHLIHQIYEDLLHQNWGRARETWLEYHISARAVFKTIAELVHNSTTIEDTKKKKVFLLLAQSDYQAAVGADPEIQLLAFAIQFIDVIA